MFALIDARRRAHGLSPGRPGPPALDVPFECGSHRVKPLKAAIIPLIANVKDAFPQG